MSEGSKLAEFTVPSAVPGVGFDTVAHLVVSNDFLFVRFEQEREDRKGTDCVVMSVAQFVALADKLKQRH